MNCFYDGLDDFHLWDDLAISSIAAVSMAIQGHPEDGAVYRQRAYWCEKLNRKEAAESDLKEVASIAANFVTSSPTVAAHTNPKETVAAPTAISNISAIPPPRQNLTWYS